MNIVWFASYPPRSNRHENRDPIYLIRALKHLSNGPHNAAYRLNRSSTLDTKNVGQALKWFGKLGKMVLGVQKLSPPVVLVPIPDSNCTPGCSPRTLRLCQAIAVQTSRAILISDILRWKNPQTPSHRGGTRDKERLCRQLVVSRLPDRGTIVLVDDVLTTGAHILASAEKIKRAGFRCEHALCVARTEARSDEDVFGIRQVTLLHPTSGHPS